MKTLYRLASEFLKVIVVAGLLFAAIYNGSSYLGWQGIVEGVAKIAPLALVSEERYLSIVADGIGRETFRKSSFRFQAGSFSVVGLGNVDQSLWQRKLVAAETFLSENIGRRPLWMPAVELRSQEGLDGSYDGLSMVIDPANPEPFRIVIHEMTHLFLFWALFPGLPFDCPRWFNEGCAEWISGMLSGDSDGRWVNDIIPDQKIVSFAAISPGFSRSESYSDIQARHAFGVFLEKFGWPGVRAILSGLACARPFHAVFQQEFQTRPELFEEACQQEFHRRYALSGLSFEQAWKRLEWLIDNQRDQQVLFMIQAAMKKWPKEGTLVEGTRRLREHQINDCLSLGKPLEAMGWWKMSRGLLVEQVSGPLLKKISDSLRKNASPVGKAFAVAISPTKFGPVGVPGKGSPNPGFVLAWLGLSWAILQVFRQLRRCLLPFLSGCWSADYRYSQEIRWLMLLLFSTGCAWFIRLLVIGFIPYGGGGGLPDFQRQILSEAIIAALWVCLGIQVLSWERKQLVQIDEHGESFAPSVLRDFPKIAGGSVYLILGYLLLHYRALYGAVLAPQPLLEGGGLVMVVAHVIAILAGDFLVFTLVRTWLRKGALHLLSPAMCYAFLRGWYPVGFSGFFLLLVTGYALCAIVRSCRSILLPMLVDCFCMFPAIVGIAGAWIPLIPVGPFLPEVGNPAWWHGFILFAGFLVFLRK